MSRPFVRRIVIEIVLVAAAYYVAARLAGLLIMPGSHVSPMWPPSGIALAAVMLLGRRVAWGVGLGSLLVNFPNYYHHPSDMLTALGFATSLSAGATLTALLGAELLQRYVSAHNSLNRVRDVCMLLGLGGITSCLLSASIGVTTFTLSGTITLANSGATWLTWWLGDTTGVLVVAPLVLAWWRPPESEKFTGRWLEAMLCFSLLAAVTTLTFVFNNSSWLGNKPLAFFPIPFLVWPTLRFGQRGATTAIALVSLIAVWGTIHNAGPFYGYSPNATLLLLELFVSVVVLTALIIGAMSAERRNAEQQALNLLEARVRERTIELQLANDKLVQENSIRTVAETTAQQLLIEADRTRATLLSLLAEQKRTEESLRQSEQTFSSAFEHTIVGTGMVNTNGQWMRVNTALCGFLGYSADELLMMGPQANTHAEDIASGRDQMQQLIAGKIEQYTCEKRFIHHAGHIVWGLQSTSLIRGSASEPRFAVVQIVDINQRVEAEAQQRETDMRFRQLAENIEEVFWVVDPHVYQVLYISPAYEKIWGRSCQEVYASPLSWQEAIDVDDRERVRAAVNHMTTANYDIEYRIHRPDGTQRWIRDKAFLIRDTTGAISRVVGVAEDITGRLQLEAQLRQSQKMEAIGTLAGGIAHDFNNILAAIKGYTQLAKSDIKDQLEVQKYLDAVLQGARRATELVKQITTFSRHHETKHSPVALPHIVKEALILLRATIPSSIDINVTTDDSATTILADATQMHQVIMNLCTNAAHAMKAKPGRLDISVEKIVLDHTREQSLAHLNAGDYVRLTIADTGCGMDQTTLARIFEPFFTTKRAGEGSGLGLSVVHGIVLSHHGAITVNSVVGVGSTFKLYFPECRGEPVQASLPTPPRTQLGKNERILLIDDEPALVQLVSTMLERLGYSVQAHAHANEAIDALRASPAKFDLVISDLSMPAMSGLELAAQLRQVRPDIPIILISGYVDSSTAERIAQIGIQSVLPKPFTVESLGSTIQQVLSTNRLHEHGTAGP